MSRPEAHKPKVDPRKAAGAAVVCSMFADGGRVPTTDEQTVESLRQDAQRYLETLNSDEIVSTEAVLEAIHLYSEMQAVEDARRPEKEV
jgi:hypothetical protein